MAIPHRSPHGCAASLRGGRIQGLGLKSSLWPEACNPTSLHPSPHGCSKDKVSVGGPDETLSSEELHESSHGCLCPCPSVSPLLRRVTDRGRDPPWRSLLGSCTSTCIPGSLSWAVCSAGHSGAAPRRASGGLAGGCGEP